MERALLIVYTLQVDLLDAHSNENPRLYSCACAHRHVATMGILTCSVAEAIHSLIIEWLENVLLWLTCRRAACGELVTDA